MITCPSCGSSTPLPADLTIATFSCGSCRAELRTVDYAGRAAVSADALVEHLRGVAAKPPADAIASIASAPRFEGGSAEAPPGATDEERFRLDMERQVAGNEALRRLVAEGVTCRGCGGHNTVPDDDSVQLSCSFCGATLLLADYVDASAVARRRLKHGVFAVRDQLLAAEEARQRRVRWIVLAVVAVVVVVLGAGFAVASLAGAVLALL